MALTYRMHTQDDEPNLVRLWSRFGGWDDVDVDTWAHRLLRPPFGPASIVVAEDTDSGEIVGQVAFIPWRVTARGREVLAYRAFAPIFAVAARGPALVTTIHPIFKMYWHGVAALKARDADLVYMMPDPRWRRFLRPFPFLDTGSFPFWSLPLPGASPIPLDEGYTAGALVEWGEEVDRLWRVRPQLDECQLVRDSAALQWKVGGGDYQLTSIRRHGEMVGLVASKHKGDRQWLICDTLALDDAAFRASISAVTNLVNVEAQRSNSPESIRKVGILKTSAMEPVLQELGYRRDDYDFHLMVHVLNPAVRREDTHPSRWYLCAND